MSNTKTTTGLTFQEGKGYKKCIGWYMHEDGKPRPKIHWLGHNEDDARFLAFTLQKAWRVIDAQGRGWTPQDIANVKQHYFNNPNVMIAQAMAGIDAQVKSLEASRQVIVEPFKQPAAVTPTQDTPADRPMLYAAVKAYCEAVKGKRFSDKHKGRAQQVLNVNMKAIRKDCPLDEIDFAWIDAMCDHWKARPANLKDGKPMTPAGVANLLRYTRLFFVWLDDSSWGGWEAPRKLNKPFKVRQADLMTPLEMRAAGTIEQFTVKTLVKLYRAATDRQRAIMLCSLFTGATQQELAVMEQSEFDLDKGTLHHFRNKTHVEGKYWLPPELVDLLKAEFATRKKDTLAFRTADGNALVTFKDGRQTSDAVRQAWDDLRETAKLPAALSFKYLRKWLGDWMKRHGGEHIAQVALSQRPTTVLSKNYTSARDFAEFNKLQKRMHQELTSAGMFEVIEKTKSKGKRKAA